MAHLALALAAGTAVAADLPLDVTLDEVLPPADDAAIYAADLAVTPDGTVHVLVGENISDELRTTNDAEGTWSPASVVSGKDDSGPSNLEVTLDADGRVAAVFDPGPGDVLGLARRDDDGMWTVDPLTNGARAFRVVFTDDGAYHVAFSDGGLVYGTNASGSFATEDVRSAGAFEEREPVLVPEGGDAPAIAFVDRSDFSNPTVQLARREEAMWTFETVSEDGAGPLGVVRAEDGTLHAVFGRDDGAGHITWVHATDPGTGWTEEPVTDVDGTGVFDGSPLDVALVGDQIVWADATGGLRFQVGTPGAWRTFLADATIDARIVRLVAAGDRLLALVVHDDTEAVSLATLDVADDDSDGMPNAFDGCPDDDAKTEPGVCGCGVEETDPCPTDDTDDTDDTDVADDTDGTDGDVEGGCGCATGGTGSAAALVGLLAFGGRARRRR